ncbi:unnamed protein product [Phytophthora fragariaefolia]|uniref:Unnamed protein product n=1 Tax=Phytophthora fragariaefolia TaxID=1490495 RepID=A0A9W6X7D3_9STRA|nr:unnamed protein product [Phytophthora fragariaefolia]
MQDRAATTRVHVAIDGRGKRLRTHTDQDEQHKEVSAGEIDSEAEHLWLQIELSSDQWSRLEKGLQSSNMQVTFAMNEQAVGVKGCWWFIGHFAATIIARCADSKVRFERDRLHRKKGGGMLVGRPSTMNRDLWLLLKRGYLSFDVGALSGEVRIFVRPVYTGKASTNLSLNEVEYRNSNEVGPEQLVEMIQQWGGTDMIVVSHTRYQGIEQLWPPIWCM